MQIEMANAAYQTFCVTLTANKSGGWMLESDGPVGCRECSPVELRVLIQQLESEGWSVVGVIDHKAKPGNPTGWDLYFRRTIDDGGNG